MNDTKHQSSIDIFISHASEDSEIARALIELIRSALNVRPERIRCTSVDGYKLPVGSSTDDRLRQEICGARFFIGLITRSSVQSVYVLFELGARWGVSLSLAPLLAGGAGPSLLCGPLKGMNALSCEVRADLFQLIVELGQQLGTTPSSASVYDKKIDALLEQSMKTRPFPGSLLYVDESAANVSEQGKVNHYLVSQAPAVTQYGLTELIGEIRLIKSTSPLKRSQTTRAADIRVLFDVTITNVFANRAYIDLDRQS